MISIILYGRNDSYGYNLHKRAALSLNCMSEVLTEASDEVIFVDYNTPDDYPTFPEAIQDTLTERAKQRLRILRVRPSIHARFAKRTHLLALEPIARNIAVRRSNPGNRWILSTNTDMIFVPLDGASLSASVKDLPRGFYHLPRFEIPETLWETFDRKDALGTIKAIRHWGRAAHLNEIVLGAPFIRFDGPGDFQLIERDDLIRIHGFDEEMLLGWHVDSNIAKRLYVLYGKIGDLLDRLYGYHCDHTRQVTPAHRSDSVSNEIARFVDLVEKPNWEADKDAWGCPHDDIEEIRLDRTRNNLYLEGLAAVITEEMKEPTTSAYVHDTYDRVSYDAPHVLPFLADIFVNAPPGTKIAWIGANPEMFRLFAQLWRRMGFAGALLIAPETADHIGVVEMGGVEIVDFENLAANADAFIFDLALNDGNSAKVDEFDKKGDRRVAWLKWLFLDLVGKERERLLAGHAPRRVVCVNAIHNASEHLATTYLSVARTPFSSRIRQGFVKPASETGEPTSRGGEVDWTKKMRAGSAGIRSESKITAQKDKIGHVIYGPYIFLLPGRYRAAVELSSPRPMIWSLIDLRRVAVLEVVIGVDIVLAQRDIGRRDLEAGKLTLPFSITPNDLRESDFAGVEVRIWSAGTAEFGVKSVTISVP